MKKKLPATGPTGPLPNYYGDGPRDYGVECLVATNPDVWQPVRDDESWNGWIWRWSKQQAENEAKTRKEQTGVDHRVFKHGGTP